ncbi:MAG TPA: phosphotransferase family protein [Capillimicrobium sp.]|nr:phosphotransferase family protein [Capillimicrobium sp.]
MSSGDVVPEHGVPTKQVQRDLAQARGVVRSWLADHLTAGDDLHVGELSMPAATGTSNESLLFTATWSEDGETVTRRFVLRLDNPHSLYLESPARLHYEVCEVLGEETSVPVPAVLAYEPDPSLLGVPFFLMEHVEGRAPSDQPPFNVEGWVVDLDPGERRTMWRNFVEVMASMHQLDVGLLPMLEGRSLAGEVDRWVRHPAWTHGDQDPHPVLSATATWLQEHLPQDAPAGFAWGDARLQNVLFGAGGAVSAVVDLDMVSLAGGESDLAWFCVCNHYQSALTGRPQLEGIGTGRETVELWQRLVGREPRHWDYHLVLATYRLALVMARLAVFVAAAGMPEVAGKITAENAAIPYLAQMLDLPWEGPVTYRWDAELRLGA